MTAPIIKWCTSWGTEILPVTCIKESPKRVWLESSFIDGRGFYVVAANKISAYAQYHDTWADAKAHLTANAEARIASARRELEQANAFADKVTGLREPAEAQS